MISYRCIIADDETLARQLLSLHLARLPHIQVVAVCSNSIETMNAIMTHQPDLLLLDIQMPPTNSLEWLKQAPFYPVTILTTAYSQYAIESYELDISGYLLKPIEFDRLEKAVQKAILQVEQRKVQKLKTIPTPSVNTPAETPKHFIVNMEHQLVQVLFDDVLFIEAMQKYVRIHTIHQRIITMIGLSQLEKVLPPHKFKRIHRSYIVNFDKIERIAGSHVIVGKHELPVSKGQYESFRTAIEQRKLK